MRHQINKLLFSLGIHRNHLGFHYLRYAMLLSLDDENYMLAIYKELFIAVANHYHTKLDSVDHCIRTAVKICWEHGNRSLLKELSGYPLHSMPTNSEFLDIIFCHLEAAAHALPD